MEATFVSVLKDFKETIARLISMNVYQNLVRIMERVWYEIYGRILIANLSWNTT